MALFGEMLPTCKMGSTYLVNIHSHSFSNVASGVCCVKMICGRKSRADWSRYKAGFLFVLVVSLIRIVAPLVCIAQPWHVL